MCSYYRKFIPHFSEVTKCFNDMTKKGAVFNWTRECDNAFKLLKEKLIEEPVLMLYTVTLLRIVIQVYYSKPDQEQRSSLP